MRSDMDIFRPRSAFGDWNRLQKQMNRLFDEFTDEFKEMQSLELPTICPSCDVEDTDDHFIVSVDMPGIAKDNIKVEVANNVLSISGEKKEEKERRTKNRYLSERSEGSFFRSLSLPADVDPQKIEAAYENGVLKVAIPKAQATRSHQVSVSSGLSNFVGKFLPKKDTQKVKVA